MRKLLPVLTLAAVGCGSENVIEPWNPPNWDVNPRPLEPTLHTDRILQVTQPEVDVLWVVDNSCSMGTYQSKLVDNFPVFFEYFEGSGMDYHIGVVSTDMDGMHEPYGRLVTRYGHRYLEPDTPNAAELFEKMAILGSSGSGWEKGKDATYAALETERLEYNLGFQRENSAIHVIVVTDEDDSSEITSDELAAYLNGLRHDPDDVTFSAIVNYSFGAGDYLPVKNKVGGIEWDIQDEDWTQMLEHLGLQAAGLKREYFLSKLPVLGTIQVSVVENEITYKFTEGADWAYDPVRNSIAFHDYVPNPMAEVLITYRILSTDHGN